MTVDGKLRTGLHAHRASWILHFGDIPAGLFVCHRCDNRPCVRPSHLFLGTHMDNMDDAKSKGRLASGAAHGSHTHPERVAKWERNGGCKISADTVREIRRLATLGLKSQAITDKLKLPCHRGHVASIIRGQFWKGLK